MDPMREFIGRRNIELFVSHLETEADLNSRSAVRRLLVEEEDKFGRLCERLDILDQYIERTADHIRKQKERLDMMEDDESEIDLARRILANLEDIHRLFLDHRSAVKEELDRGLI